MNDFDMRKLVLDQLKWLAVYMGIAFIIAILLPFPIDWLVAIPVFLLLSLYRRKLFFRKINMHFKDRPTTANLKGIKEFFKFSTATAAISRASTILTLASPAGM